MADVRTLAKTLPDDVKDRDTETKILKKHLVRGSKIGQTELEFPSSPSAPTPIKRRLRAPPSRSFHESRYDAILCNGKSSARGSDAAP